MAITQEQGIDLEPLEGIVDRHGLRGTLEMLAYIASEKAIHLAVNWQDAATAKSWERDAALIRQTYDLIDNQ